MMRRTADDYLVGDVLCARTGCQTYRASEIGLVGDGPVTVYRPESAVFDRASLATFAGKPVTLGHPADPVNSDNWKTHAVGDIGEEIARDGETVRVSIKLMDAAAIKPVEGGTRQISMGYTTPMVMQDGVAPDGTKYQAVQTGPIVINHMAIVDRARGGDKLRIDHDAGDWGAAPISSNPKQEANMADALKNVVLGDQAAQVAVDSVGAVEAYKAWATKSIKDAEGGAAAKIAEKEEQIGALKAEIDDLKKQVPTADALDALVAERAALVADADKLAGLKDAKGTPADIRKAVVAKRLGDASVVDVSDAEISGMFRAIKAQGVADPFKTAISDGVKVQVSDADTAYTAMLADMQTAWQGVKKEAN